MITALFSDDELLDNFVLKGGNALDIIYHIGSRSSVDIDLSIPEDFEDLEDAKTRIFQSLRDRFDSVGHVVFDEKFTPRPSHVRKGKSPRWGGYQIEFKIISREIFEQHQNDLSALRRNAAEVGPAMKRTFKIDISKYEFCLPKQKVELDDYTIYVYSLPMMAIEKLRAICQQMLEYEQRPYQSPRARDFLDIYTIITIGKIKIASPENTELLKNIFAAKEVPLSLLPKIEKYRNFHRTDWDAVRQTTSDELEDFDFYFDFVLALVKNLQPFGIK